MDPKQAYQALLDVAQAEYETRLGGGHTYGDIMDAIVVKTGCDYKIAKRLLKLVSQVYADIERDLAEAGEFDNARA